MKNITLIVSETFKFNIELNNTNQMQYKLFPNLCLIKKFDFRLKKNPS